MSEVAWCQSNAERSTGIKGTKRPGGVTWNAMSMFFRIPCAKNRFKLPTACLFSYKVLPQGSDSGGESSHTDLLFSNGGTALLQKVAPALDNWFQRMSVVIGVDESLCQEGHDDANRN